MSGGDGGDGGVGGAGGVPGGIGGVTVGDDAFLWMPVVAFTKSFISMLFVKIGIHYDLSADNLKPGLQIVHSVTPS